MELKITEYPPELQATENIVNIVRYPCGVYGIVHTDGTFEFCK